MSECIKNIPNICLLFRKKSANYVLKIDSFQLETQLLKHSCPLSFQNMVKYFYKGSIYTSFGFVILCEMKMNACTPIDNASKACFPLGGILRAERNFSLSFLISSTREITRQRKNPLRAQNSA
jgi:hypothetical protein